MSKPSAVCNDSCTFVLRGAAAPEPLPEPARVEAPPEPERDRVEEAEPTSQFGLQAVPSAQVLTFEPLEVTGRRRPAYVSAPTLEAVAEGERTLGRGHQGAAVRRMQRALIATGRPLAEDGKFGPRTRAAVRDFQRTEGIVGEDGRIGPRTLHALQARYEATWASSLDGLAPPVRDRARELIGTTRLAEFTGAVADLTRSAEFRALTPALQTAVLEDIGQRPTPEARRHRLAERQHQADAGALGDLMQMWDALGRLPVFRSPGMSG